MGNFSVEISMKINGNDVSVEKEVEINEDMLMAECSYQASKYCMWAAASSEAERLARTAKRRLDVVEAELSKKVRLDMIARGDKPTDTRVEMEVKLTPEWQQATSDLIDAKFKESMLEKAEKGFLQRKDMIQSMVSMKMREQNAPPGVYADRARLSRGG
jgi:hypothetical protein